MLYRKPSYTTVVALLWAGTLFGVSFLATPVKFQAPLLSLPVALDVGRHTFALFNQVEWGFALGLSLLLWWEGVGSRTSGLATFVLVAILFMQTYWLLPVLDGRVAAVIAGTPPPPSYEHSLYAGLEGVKLLLLLIAALSKPRQSRYSVSGSHYSQPIIPRYKE